MDPQYNVLSHKIDDLSDKIDDLTTKVTTLQVLSGDGTAKFRIETAEREISILFERGRELERAAELRREAVDERLQKLQSLVSNKISFWKGAASLASGIAAILLVMIDIALRLFK